MHTIMVAQGVHWVAIPEADLSILCGCPADSVKLLMKKGLIVATEKNGVAIETGPNAILLSDVPTQNETFCNLSEFPILQMLYRQGMIVPGHPGNTGRRPLLIGLESQVRSQSQYIFRGNYGLSSIDELVATGVSRETAQDYMRMKLWFAFGRIRQTDEMLETRSSATGPVAAARRGHGAAHGVQLVRVRLRRADGPRGSQPRAGGGLLLLVLPGFPQDPPRVLLRRAYRRGRRVGYREALHGQHRHVPGANLSHRRRSQHRAVAHRRRHQRQRDRGNLPFSLPRRSFRGAHLAGPLRSPRQVLRHGRRSAPP